MSRKFLGCAEQNKLGQLVSANRLNNIKSVYHGEHGLRTLKELARSYLTISKDLTRVMTCVTQIEIG